MCKYRLPYFDVASMAPVLAQEAVMSCTVHVFEASLLTRNSVFVEAVLQKIVWCAFV